MPRYDLILPAGEVLLVNPETGAQLKLSAAAGPLRLGSVELSFSLDIAPVPADAPGTPQPQSGPLTEAPASASGEGSDPPDELAVSEPGEAIQAFHRMQSLPPGFGEETEEPFGREASPRSNPSLPPVRVLDAPLEALTQDEFELTLRNLIQKRDEAERELAFLDEIGGDPQDMDEIRDHADALDTLFSSVSHRFAEWQRLQKMIDRERGEQIHDE